MKDIFIWFYQAADRIQGIPLPLNTTLAEEFNPKNPMPGFDYPWVRYNHYTMTFPPPTPDLQLPDHLFFIVKKEKELLFDFINFKGAYKIVSKEFLQYMQAHGVNDNYELAKLTVLSNTGKPITKKEYFALRFGRFDDDLIYFDESTKLTIPNLRNRFVYSKVKLRADSSKSILFVDNFCYQESILLTEEISLEIKNRFYFPAIYSDKDFAAAFIQDNEW